jgi:hypothetical protein
MTEENFIPFEEFYNPQQPVEVEHKSESEILSDVREILNSHKWGGER